MPLPLIAVPNVSEGRRIDVIEELRRSVEGAEARVLDVHSDPVHNRSVLTIAGHEEQLVGAAAELARASRAIDLTEHTGIHPRLGSLDVYPFVIVDEASRRAVGAARRAAHAIWETAGLPVYLYGEAARRDSARDLPSLRAGGLAGITRRAGSDLPPDVGAARIDPRYGVVCVGARTPLIAFNVWVKADAATAQRIAARIRPGNGGPRGVRSFGWSLGGETSQVSMNLTAPDETGIDRAFDEVARWVDAEGVAITATEIVGLPLERHLPDPKREAARLLIEPGRSLESVLLS